MDVNLQVLVKVLY